ncbi:MAG: chitin deacetylase, partial [Proteobacteria bacterium]|nr:chitin deacetylase [Pseudomonadota bacterium]
MVGYGANPPDPRWPGGARLAVNFVINYEEGSEASIFDGEAQTETGLTEGPGPSFASGARNLGAESMFEYGSRAGFWRLMRLFAAHDMPLTIFGCALALERNLEAAAAIREAGHDVCC